LARTQNITLGKAILPTKRQDSEMYKGGRGAEERGVLKTDK